MMTFINLVKGRDDTLILIQDSEDSVFGAFNVEEWHYAPGFYGNGESFVFNFDMTNQKNQGYKYTDVSEENNLNMKTEIENINVYYSTNENTQFQHCDEKSITIGSSLNGDAAIHIGKYFKTGESSIECQTFDMKSQLVERSRSEIDGSFIDDQQKMRAGLSRLKDFTIKRFEVWGFDFA